MLSSQAVMPDGSKITSLIDQLNAALQVAGIERSSSARSTRSTVAVGPRKKSKGDHCSIKENDPSGGAATGALFLGWAKGDWLHPVASYQGSQRGFVPLKIPLMSHTLATDSLHPRHYSASGVVRLGSSTAGASVGLSSVPPGLGNTRTNSTPGS